MAENIDHLLDGYAAACAAEKEAVTYKKGLQKQIEEALGDDPIKIEHNSGTFTMVARQSWEYSEATKLLAEDLKIQQVDEQEDGTAVAKVTHGLRFNADKTRV